MKFEPASDTPFATTNDRGMVALAEGAAKW
jgi:hypothetical protein